MSVLNECRKSIDRMEKKDDKSPGSGHEPLEAENTTLVTAKVSSNKHPIADKIAPSGDMDTKPSRHHSQLLDIKNETCNRHRKSRGRKITASSLLQAQKGLKKLDSTEKRRIEKKSSGAAVASMMERFMGKRDWVRPLAYLIFIFQRVCLILVE